MILPHGKTRTGEKFPSESVRRDVHLVMTNAATRLVVETSVTGHNVYAYGDYGSRHLGPIALFRAPDAFDAIPLALARAAAYGYTNVSPDVELRRFGGERVAAANFAFAAACGR